MPARLLFSRKTSANGGSVLKMPAFGVAEQTLPAGQQIIVRFTPDRTGYVRVSVGGGTL